MTPDQTTAGRASVPPVDEAARPPARRGGAGARGDHALAELVSRVVERGVVISGDLVVSVAGVDLLYLGLDVLLAATDRLERPPRSGGADEIPGRRRSPGEDPSPPTAGRDG